MDRGDKRPANPDGSLPHPDPDSIDSDESSVGCHRRAFESLNIHNAQPDFVYQWERKDQGKILGAAHRGWRVVEEGDPEYTLMDTDGTLKKTLLAAGLDSSHTTGDVVLMRIRKDLYAELIEQRQEAAMRPFTQAAEGGVFLNRDTISGTPVVHGRKDIYYRRQEHGVTFEGPMGEER